MVNLESTLKDTKILDTTVNILSVKDDVQSENVWVLGSVLKTAYSLGQGLGHVWG